MIVKVCKPRSRVTTNGEPLPRRRSDEYLGRGMRGLISYLVGPGKHNEHTDPTLVAAASPLDIEFSEQLWTDPLWGSQEVSTLARQLDEPLRLLRSRHVDIPEDRGWVLHVSLSLEPGTRVDKETWGKIAQDYIAGMGWDGSDGRDPLRWAAFHHGISAGGNDHIHLAVMMIRDSGTWTSTHRMLIRSQQVRRTLEDTYRLAHAEDAAHSRGHQPYGMIDAARTRNEQDRRTTPGTSAGGGARLAPEQQRLQHAMLAALGAASDEADYVRRLWRSGILTRPRFAKGTIDVVVGYSVALRPQEGQRPFWHAAGKVHPSLTLTNIRRGFPDTPDAALRASLMWRGASENDPPSTRPFDAGAAADALGHIRAYLDDSEATVTEGVGQVDDAPHQWAGPAATAWAAAATRLEPDGTGPICDAAIAHLREATRYNPKRSVGLPPHSGMAHGVRLLLRAGSRNDVIGWAAVIEQLVRTTRAIADARTAHHDTDNARYLLQRVQPALDYARTVLATSPGATKRTGRPIDTDPAFPDRRDDRQGPAQGR